MTLMRMDNITTMHTLNLTEAAEFLKINPKTAQAMAAKGELPGARIGTCWVFLLDEITKYLRTQTNLQQQERLEKHGPTNVRPLIERPKPKTDTSPPKRTKRKIPPSLDGLDKTA